MMQTPSQAQSNEKSKRFHVSIAAKAAEHEASKKSALIAELKQCCEPKPEPKPTPEPVEDGWVERQIENQKPLWFSVVSAVKVTPSGAPTIRTIQRATCDVYGISLNDLLSARRTANFTMPRMVSVYLAKELTSLSWIRIGKATGDRDHSTAISAQRKIARLLQSDDGLAAKIALIRERLP